MAPQSHSNPPASLPTETSTNSFWHFEPSSLLRGHRTTRYLPSTADVVIIGSGMTGASVAYHLLSKDSTPAQHTRLDTGKDDMSVVMLEAREACWGATGRNGGHCYPTPWEHPHDTSIGTFEHNNLSELQRIIAAKNIDCEFQIQDRGIRAIYDARTLEDTKAAIAHLDATHGCLTAHVHLVTEKAELTKLGLKDAMGAVVSRPAAKLWPYKFVAAILTDLLTNRNLFGTFNLQSLTPATSIAKAEGNAESATLPWVVSTPRGDIRAKKVVFATNAYTSHLLPDFADLIVPVRGQMSALLPPSSTRTDGSVRDNSFGFLGAGVDDYLVQRVDPAGDPRGAHFMLGGGRQHDPESVGTTDDSVINEDVARYLRSRLPDALDMTGTNTGTATEAVELTATHEWTGIMGFSRDDLPWVGPLPFPSEPSTTPPDRSSHAASNIPYDANEPYCISSFTGHCGITGYGEPPASLSHLVPNAPQKSSGLFISAGYTGHGMPNAWLSGRFVAHMVTRDLQSPHLAGTPARSFAWASGETSWVAPVSTWDEETDKEVVGMMPKHDVERELASVGLPEAYLVTEERIRKAKEMMGVGMKDRAEMQLGTHDAVAR